MPEAHVVVVSINATLSYGRRYRITLAKNSMGSGPQVARFIDFVADCGAPTYVDSADSAVWRFGLDLGVADAGSYTVCFREPGGEFQPIPAEDSKYLQIEKLDADRTHPRGIFHNQYFSAMAGSVKALNVSVAGTRVPVPSDSKVVISRGKSCGNIDDFEGVEVRPARPDDHEKPQLVSFSPASGAVSTRGVVVLEFNEAVKLGDGCFGPNGTQPSFTFTSAADSSDEVSFSCDQATVDRSRVLLNPTSANALTSGTAYYLQVEVGAVVDLAGRSSAFIITDPTSADAYAITAGDEAPEIIGSEPASGLEGPTVFAYEEPALNDDGS